MKHASVSHKHFSITKKEQGVLLQDLGSRNGTFVNGVMTKKAVLKAGDKISVNDLILELHCVQEPNSLLSSPVSATPTTSSSWGEESASASESESDLNMSYQAESKSLTQKAKDYLDNVVCSLAKLGEFQWVLASIVGIYVLMVTTLAIFPMVQIAKERIEKESQLRAADIARSLAGRYRAAINAGLGATFSVNEQRLEGVQSALVIASNDGHILAPASKAGAYSDLPFVNKARRFNQSYSEKINSSTTGASYPIRAINAAGEDQVRAFAMVIYDVSSRTIRSNDIIRLFVQVLAFAVLLGFVLFLLLYRFVEYPIFAFNKQLDRALREHGGEVSTNYHFPELEKLSVNINTALSRIPEDAESAPPESIALDSQTEVDNLSQLVSSPHMIVSKENIVIAMNELLEEISGLSLNETLNNAISDINDQSLQLNLSDLIQAVVNSPEQIASSELEFSGSNYTIQAQALFAKSDLKYILIVFSTEENNEEEMEF